MIHDGSIQCDDVLREPLQKGVVPEEHVHSESKMIADYLWLFATLGGAAIIGITLIYGIARQRRLSQTEKNAQDHKVKEMYEKRDR